MGKAQLERHLTLQKRSKCHCPQSSSQSRLLPALRSSLCIWLRCVQHRCWQGAGSSWKTQFHKVFLSLLPKHLLNPLLILVTVHCRNIQASQKLRAFAVCPHMCWGEEIHNNVPVDSETTATFTFPLTGFLSLGRRARTFAVQWGASSTQEFGFLPSSPLKLNVWY